MRFCINVDGRGLAYAGPRYGLPTLGELSITLPVVEGDAPRYVVVDLTGVKAFPSLDDQ
jgi:hypothetical protein